MIRIVLTCLLIIAAAVSGCKISAVQEPQNIQKTTVNNPDEIKMRELTEAQKALKEIAFSYYMRGKNIQYNPEKGEDFSPEDATVQNLNYLVCSRFVKNVYRELLGIAVPPYTMSLLQYAKDNVGRPEVIAYGCKDGNRFTMKLYDPHAEKRYSVLEKPSLKDIIPFLRCGDILTYTGHTVLVYDLIYDHSGKVTDALVMQGEHGEGKHYVITKLPWKTEISDSVRFGGANAHLFHNISKNNAYYSGGQTEGSINLTQLTMLKHWKEINSGSALPEYSVLRFLHRDKDGRSLLIYKGGKFGDKDYDEEEIRLTEAVKDRLKFSKLYIEKTVNAHADNVVTVGDTLEYTITVKNNSDSGYKDDISIREELSDYVKFVGYKTNKKNITVTKNNNDNEIAWNIGKLNKGEEVQVSYTVSVKEKSENKIIESAGRVEHLSSSVLRNFVGRNLTGQQKKAIKTSYEILKSKYAGKMLVNEIYKQALGIELRFDKFDITDLIQNKNIRSNRRKTIDLNRDNIFYPTILNKYWGTLSANTFSFKDKSITAYSLKNWNRTTDVGRRADTVYGNTFMTGDILVYRNTNDVLYSYNHENVSVTPITYENGEYAFIYIDGLGFVGVNPGNDAIQGTPDDRNEFTADYYKKNNLSVYSNRKETDSNVLEFANLQSLFGKDYYVILRPSLNFR